MPLLGAHMSIAGGFHKAVDAAARLTMDVVQIFTHAPQQWPFTRVNQEVPLSLPSGETRAKSRNQWRAKPMTKQDVAAFGAALANRKIRHPLAHSSYLVNLAAPDDALWQKSIEAMVVELSRAQQLGVPYVVMHPGAYTTTSEEAGLARIVAAIDQIHAALPKGKSRILLENTAGQGSCLGCKFEHLAAIIEGVKKPGRLGVCFDTCHAFAAGYPLAERKDYLRTMREFDEVVGIERLKAFHLNDSKRELGSRVDRHEHIGQGKLGLAPFAHLLTDRRFREIPMYLETPKGMHEGQEWDAINLATLRGLCK